MFKNIKSFILPLMLVLVSFSNAQHLLNESFTATTFPPTGWLLLNYGGGEKWKRVTSKYNSYPACAEMKTDRNDVNNDWLITPRIGPMQASDSLIFYYLTGSATLYETLKVKVSLNSTQSDTTKYDTTLCIIKANNNTAYLRKAIWLGQARFSGKQIYIAFQVRTNKKKKWIHVDDIQVYRFSTPTYTITADAYGAGTISPAGPILVQSGRDTTFYLTAEPGYHLDSLKVDGVNHGRDSTRYKFTSVSTSHTIYAYYPMRSYALNITIIGSGTVTKNPNATSYTEGTEVELTAAPSTDWHFDSWSGDLLGNDTLVSIVMDTIKNVTATFKRDTWTIYATADDNGSINPAGINPVAGGGSKSFTISAFTGYHIYDVLVDDSSVGAVGTYNFTNVTANHTIHAMFDINTYTLTLNTSGNGTAIKDPDQSYYNYGTFVRLTAIPDTGYHFVNWSGGLSSSNNPDSIYINGDKTATANFAINTYILTVNVVGSGSVTKNPNQASYNHGTWVRLTPVPQTGWHFVGWSDSLTGSNNPDSIQMKSNKVVTATFAINTYTLNVSIAGNGSVTKNPDQPTYNHGTWVRLTGNPDTGWHFVHWSGGLASSYNPDSVLLDGNKSVTATFALNNYTLTVNTSGNGSVTLTPSSGPYAHGTWVKLQANNSVTGWHFVNWSDSLTGSNNPDSIYMNSNKVVTANFAINTYTLTVYTSGNGSVIKNPDQLTYDYGTYVRLTAMPETGWHFVNWIGNLSGSNNPDSILINDDKIVTANFAINTYSLTVNYNPTGSGSVILTPPTGPYTHGTWVKFQPNPNVGWHFVNWSDSLTGSGDPDSIYMNSNKVVTANFSQTEYSLTININGSGNVVKNPDLPSYTYGTWVKLTATADTGWHFVNWSGHLTSSSIVDSILINGNKTVNANFEINTYSMTININPPGNGSVTLTPSTGPYSHGTWVKLQANNSVTGWHFVNWSDSLTGSNNPDSIYMNSNKVVTANFAINTYTLTVYTSGNGSVIKNPDQLTYDYGTYVRLTAMPETGWHFVNWTGNLSGSNNPDSILIDGDKIVTANFAINTYTLTINLNPSMTGSVTLIPTGGTYSHGTWVKLQANNTVAGWHFVNWSDSLTGSNNPDSIYINKNKVVTANFAINTYTLNITIDGNGTVTKSPDLTVYSHNQVVRLNAYPASGWYFDEWGGDLTGSSENPEYILMDGNKNVTAYFSNVRYILDVYTTGNGSVTKDPDSANYSNGTWVHLTANPDSGEEFVNWSGNLSGSNNPDSVLINGNKTVMAHFTDTDNFILHVNVIGHGIVYKVPDQPIYSSGTWVVLYSVPDSGWNFVSWIGNLTSVSNPDSILMNGNKTVYARFSLSGAAGVWVQKESMPPLNVGSSHVKDGGALIGVEGQKDGASVFAFQGTKTNFFKKYSIGGKSGWTNTDSIQFGYKYKPATFEINYEKLNKKFPGKGAALCFDGENIIYATKGNNTNEFWAYYIDTVYGQRGETLAGWKLKRYVPSLKGLKGGTSIRYYNGKVYLLAGAQKKYSTVDNFFVYDPTQDTTGGAPWTALGRLPLGPNTKAWKDGSSIIELNGTIYAVKGGDKINLFYAYEWIGDTWSRKEDIPISDTSLGKYKKTLKVKDGAATATDGNVIYATKGGGANVFWQYMPGTPGVWSKLASIPYLHKKSVPKAGAALTFADGKIWLLKGNKGSEFWCYTPAGKSNVNTQHQISNQSITAGQSETTTPHSLIDINPNPFHKLSTIHYTVPILCKVTVKLYNVDGRLIETLVNDNLNKGTYSINLSADKLAKGVYFVKYESETNKSEVKLIVQ